MNITRFLLLLPLACTEIPIPELLDLSNEGMLAIVQPPTIAPVGGTTFLGSVTVPDTHCVPGPKYYCSNSDVVSECTQQGEDAVVKSWSCFGACQPDGVCSTATESCTEMMTCHTDETDWTYEYCFLSSGASYVKGHAQCAVRVNGVDESAHACGTEGFVTNTPELAWVSSVYASCFLTTEGQAAGWSLPLAI